MPTDDCKCICRRAANGLLSCRWLSSGFCLVWPLPRINNHQSVSYFVCVFNSVSVFYSTSLSVYNDNKYDSLYTLFLSYANMHPHIHTQTRRQTHTHARTHTLTHTHTPVRTHAHSLSLDMPVCLFVCLSVSL